MGIFSKRRERIELENKKNEIGKKAYDLYINAYYYGVRFRDYGLNIEHIYNQYEADETTIDFKGIRVLDNDTYLPGTWELLLDELYLEYTRKKRGERQKTLDRLQIYKNRTSIANAVREIMDISDDKVVMIDNNIMIKFETRYSETMISGVEASSFDGYFYSVYDNGKSVYAGHAYYKDSDIIVDQFTDGVWADRVIAELDRLKKETYQNRDAVAMKYINKLRKNRR